MSPRRGMFLIVAAVLAAPSPGHSQSLFDLLTGGGRQSAPQSAPPSPAPSPSETRSAPPRPETKKRKPVAAKPSERTQKSSTAATLDAPPAADATPAPYEAQTLRLSEILGALAFLRELCAAGDGDDWRNKMTALLNAEAPSGARRDKYVAAFNSGFRGYELTYRSCTPNARAAIAHYLDEAGRLTGDLTYRYGGA
jgi:uncharacterized protein (TIGR02301 family)